MRSFEIDFTGENRRQRRVVFGRVTVNAVGEYNTRFDRQRIKEMRETFVEETKLTYLVVLRDFKLYLNYLDKRLPKRKKTILIRAFVCDSTTKMDLEWYT